MRAVRHQSEERLKYLERHSADGPFVRIGLKLRSHCVLLLNYFFAFTRLGPLRSLAFFVVKPGSFPSRAYVKIYCPICLPREMTYERRGTNICGSALEEPCLLLVPLVLSDI